LTESLKSETAGPTLIELAWLAGIVDGEGYVSFSNTPILQVESVTPSLAYVPAELVGGRVTTHQRQGASVFRWSLYGKNAVRVLELIIPYLKYKDAQAKIVVHAGKYPPNSAMRQSQVDRLSHLRKLRY